MPIRNEQWSNGRTRAALMNQVSFEAEGLVCIHHLPEEQKVLIYLPVGLKKYFRFE